MAIHIEQEVKLQVPQRFDLRALEPGVNGYTASPIQVHKLSTTYYDTDDLRLTRWGCALRHRHGQGWTLKLRPVGSARYTHVEHTYPGEGTKPPAEALELVTAFLRGKPVRPVARLRTLRKSLRLQSLTGEEVAEVVDDDVRVIQGGHITDRFREIEVELLNGAPESTLAELTRYLQDAGAGLVDQTSKSVRALGPPALVPSEVHSATPSSESSAADVVRHALASSVELLLRHDAGLRLNADPEAVHQARVATRRLRSDLRTFMPLLQENWARSLRECIKWLADELGAVRDADVLVARLRKRATKLSMSDARLAESVIAKFARESENARRKLSGILREKRYLDLLDELVDAAADPKLESQADQPAADVLPQLAEEPWKKLCKAVDQLPQRTDDKKLHQVRIKAKRCRYAVEAIAPVGGKPAVRFAKRVANVQKVLGDLHDAVVAEQRLREIKGERGEVFAAGGLAAMEALVAADARIAWRKAWKKASKKNLRSWM